MCCHDGWSHLKEQVEGFPKPPWMLELDSWLPSYEKNRLAFLQKPQNGAGPKKFDRAQLLNPWEFLKCFLMAVELSSSRTSLAGHFCNDSMLSLIGGPPKPNLPIGPKWPKIQSSQLTTFEPNVTFQV